MGSRGLLPVLKILFHAVLQRKKIPSHTYIINSHVNSILSNSFITEIEVTRSIFILSFVPTKTITAIVIHSFLLQ